MTWNESIEIVWIVGHNFICLSKHSVYTVVSYEFSYRGKKKKNNNNKMMIELKLLSWTIHIYWNSETHVIGYESVGSIENDTWFWGFKWKTHIHRIALKRVTFVYISFDSWKCSLNALLYSNAPLNIKNIEILGESMNEGCNMCVVDKMSAWNNFQWTWSLRILVIKTRRIDTDSFIWVNRNREPKANNCIINKINHMESKLLII